MKRTDFVRDVPDDVWAVFEPLLPPVVPKGNSRKPKGNRECLHGLFYLLISGVGWEMLPACFPSYKTIQRRLKLWMELDCFHSAWGQLAERYERLRGINWDKVLLDGSKKPAKKGARTPARVPSIVVSVVRPST